MEAGFGVLVTKLAFFGLLVYAWLSARRAAREARETREARAAPTIADDPVAVEGQAAPASAPDAPDVKRAA